MTDRAGQRSLRHKLTRGVILTTLTALCISGLINTYFDLTDYRDRTLQDLTTQADLIGQASIAALQFDDPRVANERLALLHLRPQILGAQIHTASDELFAEYLAAGLASRKLPQRSQNTITVSNSHIGLIRQIHADGEKLGEIYMVADYPFYARLGRDLGIVLGVAALALAVAWLMLRQLQARITAPILQITKVVEQVIDRQDYDLRAEKTADDETGYLVEAFNGMLEEIGRRTQALESSNEQLGKEIQERLQTEQALSNSELRHKTLITTLSAVVWSTDASGAFDNEQSAWGRFTGQTQTGYQGRGWLNAFHADDRVELERLWQSAGQAGHSFGAELRLWHAHSSAYRYVNLRAIPLPSADSESLEWMGIIDDIHERVESRNEIKHLNAVLEQRVVERTRELEDVNSELEAFSYSVSHDLRTPLRSIDGFAQALVEDYSDVLDDSGRDFLNRVRKAAQRMGILIDDLLKLSRVTRGDFAPTPLDLSKIAEEIVVELRDKDPGRDVAVHIHADVNGYGDGRFMRIALENLLNNAWKYTARASNASIEFGTSEQNGEARFFVKDNGAGFDMAHAGQLFGAFQRLHDARDYPGTGVGLATVQRIIRRHKGQVWAEAETNKGAVFYFTLAPIQEINLE